MYKLGTYAVRVTAIAFNDFEADKIEVKLGEIKYLDVKLVNN